MYAEERPKWCSRLMKVGNLIVYGDLKIIHLQGEIINSVANSPDKGYFNLYDKKGLQLIVSNNLRIRKQYGIGWYLFNLVMYIIEIPVFFICLFFENIFRLKNPFKNWKLAFNYSTNIFKLIALSPSIIFSKNKFYKMF